MNKQEKGAIIESLKEQFNNAQYFYFIDESTLNAGKTSELRRTAFNQNIQYSVVKNTLIKKALEASDVKAEEMYSVLEGPTAVFFSEKSNDIAKMIKDFRADKDMPKLKAAYIDSDIFIGDDQLNALVNLKSKEQLLGEVIQLLQSPAQNVISGLKANAGQKIAGLLKTLEEKEN